MRCTRTALLAALAGTVLAGCGSEGAPSSADPGPPTVVVGASPSPMKSGRAQLDPAVSADVTPSPSATSTSTTTSEPRGAGWYGDSDQRDAEVGSVWVAAWFAPEDAFPDVMVRYWMLVPFSGAPTGAEQLALSVGLLDTTPPPGMTSAFWAGLEVGGVTMAERQVRVDLAADTPGLSGHGSHGLILGESQLRSAATHYFPDAETMCIAYDGVPTDVDAGGPTFLHDASGCPLPLPFHAG